LVAASVDLEAHINNPVGAHEASAISTDGSPSWADGTTNPAADAETQFDKIVTDLTSVTSPNSGAQRIGSAGLVGSNGSGTTPAGSIYSQLQALKDGASLGAGARSSWLDGTTNPAAPVTTAIAKIIDDLIADEGSARIGSDGLPVWLDSTQVVADSIFNQFVAIINGLISQVSPNSGGHKLGVSARSSWFGGVTTNPVTTVFAAIDKIITDLNDVGANSGAHKIGIAARTSWFGGVTTNPGGISTFAALDKIITDLNDVGVNSGAHKIGIAARTTWNPNGVLNPGGISTFAALDKIITDLGNDSEPDGASFIGATDNANTLPGPNTGTLLSGSVRAQLDQLDGETGHLDLPNIWADVNTFSADIIEAWSGTVNTRGAYGTLTILGSAGPTDIWVDPDGSINNGEVVTALVLLTTVRSPADDSILNGYFAEYLAVWSRDATGSTMNFSITKTSEVATVYSEIGVTLTIGANSTTPKLRATGVNASFDKVAHVIVRRTRHPSG
jgi:hypothetical protein